MKTFARLALGIVFSGALSLRAVAGDVVSFGEGAIFNWSALPIEIGRDQGIWRKFGFDDVKPIGFGGEAKLVQAIISGDVDLGLISGPGMAQFAKGVPAKAIAVETFQSRTLSIMTGTGSSVRAAADLKGKKIGLSTAGSLSEWLAKRFAIAQGWGPEGVIPVYLGGLDSNLAALKTHEVDAILTATAVGLQLEEKHEGQIVINCGDYVTDFITSAVMARDPILAQKSEMVGRFVNGFFESIIFMKANKDKTVETGMRVFNSSKLVMERTYDIEMPNMSSDGNFGAKDLAALKESFIEMGMLDQKPTDDAILTTRFVPAKITQ